MKLLIVEDGDAQLHRGLCSAGLERSSSWSIWPAPAWTDITWP